MTFSVSLQLLTAGFGTNRPVRFPEMPADPIAVVASGPSSTDGNIATTSNLWYC